MIQSQEYKNFSWDLHQDAGHKPVVGQFEITFGCGLKCVHCYTDCYNTPERLKRELTTAETITVIDKIADGGCFWLCLTGGDPFAHPGFKEIYLHARERGLLLTLFTTGTSMTPKMADFLKERPPFNIETTIHGVTAETYEAVTQRPGSFKRFLYGINLIRDRGLPLKLKTVVMKQNQHEILAIKAFVEELGMQFQGSVSIKARLNGDTTPGTYQLSADDAIALQRQWGSHDDEDRGCRTCASDVADELEEFLKPVDPTNRLFRCGIGFDSFWVDPYGDMILCSSMRKPTYNLLQGTLQEGFEVLTEGIKEREFTGDSECTTCTLWDRCRKCAGHAYLETGDPEGDIDRECELTHCRADEAGVKHPEGQRWRAEYEAKRDRRLAKESAVAERVT